MMVDMQATTMSAVITAYSTAVGPSSLARKIVTDLKRRDIVMILSEAVTLALAARWAA
jgi:hypothetical protein